MRGKFCWFCILFLFWILINDKIFNFFRIFFKFWWMLLLIVVFVRILFVLVVLVSLGVRLWTFFYWGVLIRLFGFCVSGYVKFFLGILRLLLSVWLMSWLMLLRYSDLFLVYLSLMFWLKKFGCCLEYDFFWFFLILIKFGIKFVLINRVCL